MELDENDEWPSLGDWSSEDEVQDQDKWASQDEWAVLDWITEQGNPLGNNGGLSLYLCPSLPMMPGPRRPFAFLALPPEIRDIVYTYVLLVDDAPRKMDRRHRALCPYAPRDGNTTSFSEPPFMQEYWEWDKSAMPACGCSRRRGLGLLVANRQIHMEAAPRFWASTVFTFGVHGGNYVHGLQALIDGFGLDGTCFSLSDADEGFVKRVTAGAMRGGIVRPRYRDLVRHVVLEVFGTCSYDHWMSYGRFELQLTEFERWEQRPGLKQPLGDVAWAALGALRGLRTLEVPPDMVLWYENETYNFIRNAPRSFDNFTLLHVTSGQLKTKAGRGNVYIVARKRVPLDAVDGPCALRAPYIRPPPGGQPPDNDGNNSGGEEISDSEPDSVPFCDPLSHLKTVTSAGVRGLVPYFMQLARFHPNVRSTGGDSWAARKAAVWALDCDHDVVEVHVPADWFGASYSGEGWAGQLATGLSWQVLGLPDGIETAARNARERQMFQRHKEKIQKARLAPKS
ncbi:hypothetical protein PG989_005380 [Apiospora arundinis]|uniref:Uncharacterized protein n=1 Tax=Apiospora arundinis TaxID=335852 RepID=A0ABR2IV16_9PEZI